MDAEMTITLARMGLNWLLRQYAHADVPEIYLLREHAHADVPETYYWVVVFTPALRFAIRKRDGAVHPMDPFGAVQHPPIHRPDLSLKDSADEPGGTRARTEEGCTCPPEQLGPTYVADKDCPLHGLDAVLAGVDMKRWVRLHSDDGFQAAAPTAEAAGRAIDRMRARRREEA